MSSLEMTQHTTWDRKTWMGVLARADAARLAALAEPVTADLAHDVLRAPECGSVMARGRAGAVGAPFNLGEVTVTRASVTLACGTVGHGYVQGRGKAHALNAALIDALMQTDRAGAVAEAVLDPLARDHAEARSARAARAAATKVDFFTLVRGED